MKKDDKSRNVKGEIALGSVLVFGLLMLGSAVVIGGQEFLRRFNADDRSRAGGISCGAGECNDGSTYGQDCSAPQTSCVQRAQEACAGSKGGPKSGGGPITCGGTTTAPTSGGGGGTPVCQPGSHKECVGKPPGPLSISGTAGECFKNSGTNASPVCGWRFTGVECLNDGALREKGNEPCCTGKTYTAADGKKYCGSPTSTGTPVPTNSTGQCGTGYVKCSFSDCANATGCMPNTKTCNQWKAEKCPAGTPTTKVTSTVTASPTLNQISGLRCNVSGTNVGNCVTDRKEVGASCTNGIGNQTGLVCVMTAATANGNVTCSCSQPVATQTPSPTGPLRCASGFNPGNCISSSKSVGDACISNTNQNGICIQNSSSGTSANCTCQNSTSSSLTCTGGIAVGATRCDPRERTLLNFCRKPGGNPIGFAGGDNDMWEMQYCQSGKICQNGACINAPSGTTITKTCDNSLSENSCSFVYINQACGTSGGQCLSRGVIQSVLNEAGLGELHNCYCSSGNQTTCVDDSQCGGGVCRKIGTGSSPFICVPNEGFRCPNSSNTLTTSSTTSVSNAYLCYIERGDTNLLWRCNDGYVPNSSRTNCVLSTTTATPTALATTTQRVTATASPTPTATRVATPNTTQAPQSTPADGSTPTLSATARSTATPTALATASLSPSPTPTSAPANCDSTLWFAPLWGICVSLRAIQSAFTPATTTTPTPVVTTAPVPTCDSDEDCAGGYCGYPYPGASKICLSGPRPLVTPVPNTSVTPSPLPRACSPSSRLECCGQGIARTIEVMCTANGSQINYGECFPGYEAECGTPAPTQRATISCPFGTFDNLNTGTCDPITCAEGYTFNAANGTCVAIAGTGVRTTCDNSVALNRTACNSSDNLYQYRCINPGGDSLTQWRRERCNEGLMCSGDRCR